MMEVLDAEKLWLENKEVNVKQVSLDQNWWLVPELPSPDDQIRYGDMIWIRVAESEESKGKKYLNVTGYTNRTFILDNEKALRFIVLPLHESLNDPTS